MILHESWHIGIQFLGRGVTSHEGNQTIRMKCDFQCFNISFSLFRFQHVSTNDFISCSTLNANKVWWSLDQYAPSHPNSLCNTTFSENRLYFPVKDQRGSFNVPIPCYHRYSSSSLKASKMVPIHYPLDILRFLFSSFTSKWLAACLMQSFISKK